VAPSGSREQLTITVTRHDDGAVVVLAGEIDIAAVPELRRHFDELLDEGASAVTLDLHRLRFVDSSGLQLLLGLAERLREVGGRLEMRCVPPVLSRLAEITGTGDALGLS
jgi:anti-anti-sigma factor